MSSISEWTGLIVRDRQQGRQEVTVQTVAGTADPTSLTHSRTVSPLIPVLAREDAAASRIVPIFPFTSSVAPRAGAVSPFLTGHPQP
ncbi:MULTISPECIES: hypothetical protein [Stenotrophomonas]|uniref:Uncharacterized protein n=1 Tax=Stenotrophomonas rhizophila TaxID=216778 RepID=A0A498CGB1_9GAMM|nr:MULTISPECIES: hypothetical protein [Stenotrophomonas]KAB7631904.1 hypothetical protein F9K92_04415 [Stenotrophomonas rhizophila]MBU2049579.1 hypothetical protein [Gammaproteobacteria bacterium]RLK53286.1 hypothetical protein BCL79_2588 [Stenotrophomonas rhizophila]